MIRRIAWVSQHLEIDTLTGRLKDEKEDGEYEDIHFDEMEQKMLPQNVLSTPFGLWRVNDVMNPYKQFKLWMGHTNFTIDQNVANTIKHISGVEILNILTRYRFLVGVGELFDIRNVRVEIEKALKCNSDELSLINNEELKSKVEQLKNTLAKKHPKYAIYIFPNSTLDFVSGEVGDKKFNAKLLMYKLAVDHSSGILIEADNG